MRTRIVRLTVLVTVVAFVVFGLPLAAGLAKYFVDEQRAQLERLAEATAVSVTGDLAAPRQSSDQDPALQIAVYDENGDKVSGTGPARADSVVAGALAGANTTATLDGRYAVAVPVADGDTITGAVLATETSGDVIARIAVTWGFMAALGAAALTAAWLLARRQAQRLAAPLQDLSIAAQRLGSGDFTVRTRPTGIAEIDAVNTAVNDTAGRLGALIDRERAFSADTSHQLRTPLAGLRLQLEAALDTPGADLCDAIGQSLTAVDRLQATIEDLLTLARNNPRRSSVPLDIDALTEDARQRWHGPLAAQGRPLRIHIQRPSPTGYLSAAAATQILAVLLDNAQHHGTGAVTLTVRDAPPDAIGIDVADEGSTIAPDAADPFRETRPADRVVDGHGIGLGLARRLAESEGGRLQLSSCDPTTFTLLLPAAPESVDQQVDRHGADHRESRPATLAVGAVPDPRMS